MIYTDAYIIAKGRKASYLRRVIIIVVSISKSLYINIFSKILIAVSLFILGIGIILNSASFIVSFWFYVVNRI